MKNKNIIDFFKTQSSHLVVPLIMIVLGLFCILMPSSFIGVTVKLIGVLFVVAGVILACTLLATYSPFMMACAIVLVFMGILCLAIPKQIASLVIKMVGIVILVNAIMRIHDAYVIRGKSDGFKMYMLNDVITLIIGLVLLFIPMDVASIIVIILGVFLLILGVTNLITAYKVYRDGKFVDDGTDVVWEE